MFHSHARRAFSLVEMLVVLAVIALLAAVSLAAFERVRENGRKTVCLSNVRQITTAFALYTQDSAGQYPLLVNASLTDAEQSWAVGVQPYLGDPAVLHCPSDGEWDAKSDYVAQMKALRFPRRYAVSSYIVNYRLLTIGTIQFTPFPKLSPLVIPAFEHDVARPASTVLLCDGATEGYGQAPYTQDYPNGMDFGLGVLQTQHEDMLLDPTDAPDADVCTEAGRIRCNQAFAPNDRHLGRAVVAFADGHAKAMLKGNWYFPSTPYLDPKRGG